jgi:hypothetical protein
MLGDTLLLLCTRVADALNEASARGRELAWRSYVAATFAALVLIESACDALRGHS